VYRRFVSRAAAAVWERVRSYSAGSRICHIAWPVARTPRAGRVTSPMAGLASGRYTGARLQSRMPDDLIRRMVGVLVIAIGAYYLASGLG
jgi:uncharacterized membrane protein YfcA